MTSVMKLLVAALGYVGAAPATVLDADSPRALVASNAWPSALDTNTVSLSDANRTNVKPHLRYRVDGYEYVNKYNISEEDDHVLKSSVVSSTFLANFVMPDYAKMEGATLTKDQTGLVVEWLMKERAILSVPQCYRNTYDRAVDSLNLVNDEIESMIQKAWGR